MFSVLKSIFLRISQAISRDFSTGRIIVKTMAFGSGADASKLTQLATLGGGDFSTAVCRILVQMFPLLYIFIFMDVHKLHIRTVLIQIFYCYRQIIPHVIVTKQKKKSLMAWKDIK